MARPRWLALLHGVPLKRHRFTRRHWVTLIGNTIVGLMFLRWCLYWDAMQSLPLTSSYSLHVGEVVIYGLTLLLLALRVRTDARFVTLAKFMAVLLPLHWLLAVIVHPYDNVPLMELLMALIAMVGPCMVFAVLPDSAAEFAGKLLRFVLPFYCAQIFAGALGIVGALTGAPSSSLGSYGDLVRTRSTFGLDHMAFMLLVVHLQVNDQRRLLNRLITLATVVAIILSLERGAWLDLSLLMTAGLLFTKAPGFKRLRLLALFVLLPGLILSSSFWLPAVSNRISSAGDNDRGRWERMLGQRSASEALGDRNVLIGTGPGTCFTRAVSTSGHNPLLGSTEFLPNGDDWQSEMYSAAPHNLYITLFYEMGLFSILVWYIFTRCLVLPVLRRWNIVSWGLIATLLFFFNFESIVLVPRYGLAWLLMCWVGLHAVRQVTAPTAEAPVVPAPSDQDTEVCPNG